MSGETEEIVVKTSLDYREIFCCVWKNILVNLRGSDKSKMAGKLTCKATLSCMDRQVFLNSQKSLAVTTEINYKLVTLDHVVSNCSICCC